MRENGTKTKEEILEQENKELQQKLNQLMCEMEKKKVDLPAAEELPETSAWYDSKNADQSEDLPEDPLREDGETVMIGIAGTQHGIGITHTVIALAREVQDRGIRAAAVEMSESITFSQIREAVSATEQAEGLFSYQGIDFYEGSNIRILDSILDREYDFLFLDFGLFEDCDQDAYLRCDKKIVVAGAKPWEQARIMDVFETMPKEILRQIHFLFNHVPEKQRTAVCKGMGELQKVHFMDYRPDPFEPGSGWAAMDILKEYFPENAVEKKRYVLPWHRSR